MLIKAVKYKFQHVLVDDETWKDMIVSDPFIKGYKQKFFVSWSDTIKSIIQWRIMFGEDNTYLLLDIPKPILIFID